MPEVKKRPISDADDSGSEAVSKPAVKKTKKNAPTGAVPETQKDKEGNAYWELSNKRRVGVSQFKGTCLINIREYYEKDSKTLPGKKGISLSLVQYTTLLKAIPSINTKLRELGQLVDTTEDLAEIAEETVTSNIPEAKQAKVEKSNIEATSDEDED